MRLCRAHQGVPVPPLVIIPMQVSVSFEEHRKVDFERSGRCQHHSMTKRRCCCIKNCSVSPQAAWSHHRIQGHCWRPNLILVTRVRKRRSVATSRALRRPRRRFCVTDNWSRRTRSRWSGLRRRTSSIRRSRERNSTGRVALRNCVRLVFVSRVDWWSLTSWKTVHTPRCSSAFAANECRLLRNPRAFGNASSLCCSSSLFVQVCTSVGCGWSCTL